MRKYEFICVGSSNSVNSAWMDTMQTMVKIANIITIILIVIMIKVFNCFHMPSVINLQKAILEFIKETEISEKK